MDQTQIDNVFISTKTTYRQSGRRDGAVRKYDIEIISAVDGSHVHTIVDAFSAESGLIRAAQWLIDNRGGKTVQQTDDTVSLQLAELNAKLAQTQEALAAIQRASAPVATADEPEVKVSRRRSGPKKPPGDDEADAQPED